MKEFQSPDEITRPAWGYIALAAIALAAGLVRMHNLIDKIGGRLYANLFCVVSVVIFVGIVGLYIFKLKTVKPKDEGDGK